MFRNLSNITQIPKLLVLLIKKNKKTHKMTQKGVYSNPHKFRFRSLGALRIKKKCQFNEFSNLVFGVCLSFDPTLQQAYTYLYEGPTISQIHFDFSLFLGKPMDMSIQWWNL